MRTGVNGSSVETCTSLAFGDGQFCSGSDVSPMHFTGKWRDPESALDDFDARYYNSFQGRWMTPDWSARQEAVPYADPSSPQTLNLYAYMGNNPASRPDPDGHGGPDHLNDRLSDPLDNSHNEIQEIRVSPPSTQQAPQNNFEATQQQKTDQKRQNQQQPSEWPHGAGVGVGGSADAGIIVTGAAATGSVAGGVFYRPGDGLSTGATATGGAVAYAGNHDAGAPAQDRPARNLGASAGAGAFVFVTNATSASQLSGHFQTWTLNVGFGPIQASIQLSTGNGIWELSVSPPYGGASIGGSLSSITTETCSTSGGC